jgi:general secretion pathway protein G
MDTNASPASPRSSERGFTLVELMVVVAIIALLAAIVIPNYVHARAQAAVSQSEANIKQIATSLELYYADNQVYPVAAGGATVAPALFGANSASYMTATPTNAVGHVPYTYTSVAGAGGQPSYTILDAGPYDPTTLANLPTAAGTLCSAGGGCTKINYSPQNGIYGS